jgi:putative aldouronate transport system permease protein
MKQTRGEKAFAVLNYVLLSLMALSMVYPFVYMLSVSLSETFPVLRGDVWLFPKGFNVSAYRMLLGRKEIWTAYLNTIFYTVFGTAASMFFTICGAYPLAKKRLFGRTFFAFLIALTLWFRAGMIPFFLHMQRLHLDNTRIGIVLGMALWTTFYLILMRTYFQSIPESVEESAKMDGANDITILVRIVLPLSVPALATIGLYYAVYRWNSYFWSMVLLKEDSKIPLQVLLRRYIIQFKLNAEEFDLTDAYGVTQETFVYASIIVASIPILMVYPFLQRFFVKGIMVGSIKG